MEAISIKAETIFYLGKLAVTNSMFMAFIISVILIILALLLRQYMRREPGKGQMFVEVLMEEILSFMDTVFLDRKKSEKYFPLIALIFIFVALSNWSGLLPVAGTIHLGEVPLLRAPTSDLNFTIALAIISVFAANALGGAALGFRKFSHKYFNFKDPIMFFVGLLELVSEFVKIISFSFRLFGNIFAGEVLLIIVGFLLPYAAPLPFLFLEVFVGIIQALIFSMLTMVFINMNIAEEAH